MDTRSVAIYAEQIHNVLGLENDFDINELVKGLGGVIEKDNLNTGVVAQLSDLANEEGKPNFKVKISNQVMTEGRKRFSIAHELGHLFVHLDFLDKSKWAEHCKDSIVYYRGEITTGVEEVEANAFAAAFLMPSERFNKVAENNLNNDGSYDIDEIAKCFNVSRESAYYRGINLGIWM
ncbi:ImmA/IrrE family metallo-endopeptidase [Clostridium paraputrificum]|uniref:ImmA/IrrE family metallo-endopeptidase n=1 Tax=Clostridium paraputrificum TaxID=29363 RepID=UPI00374E4C14